MSAPQPTNGESPGHEAPFLLRLASQVVAPGVCGLLADARVIQAGRSGRYADLALMLSNPEAAVSRFTRVHGERLLLRHQRALNLLGEP
jgi:hypothetical protein